MEELLAAMRELIAAAEASEEGAMTEEQEARYNELEGQLKRHQKTHELRARQEAWEAPVASPQIRAVTGDDPQMRAFDRLLRTGEGAAEFRALGVGTDSAGGYTVPQTYRDKIVECIRSFGGLAALAETITTSDGAPLSWVTIDNSAEEAGDRATITAEHAEFTAGADIVFGDASLGAYKYTTTGPSSDPLRVSVELLQDARIDIDALITRKFAERIARKQAQHWVAGTGSGQPLGLLVGTPDVSLATGNPITYSKLLEIEDALDTGYLANASWVMSRAVWSQVRSIVDGNGRPLIDSFSDASLANGARGTLLGHPVHIEQSFPAASGDYANFMVFGDIREAYVIRRVQDLTVVRDPYTRAEFGQVQFTGWERADGTIQNRCAYVLVSSFNTP